MGPVKVGVAGKGGSGKSVLACLMARSLARRGLEPLLIDADESNRGLYWMLGLKEPPKPLIELLGGRKGVKAKMGFKLLDERLLDLNALKPPYLAEVDGVKLLVVGKVSGFSEGCACPMGALSRELLIKLRLNDGQAAVVDLEAGVEHLGRAVDEGLDALVVVTEPSYESLTLAREIVSMARAGGLKRIYVTLNKVKSREESERLSKALARMEVETAAIVRYDPLIFESCLEGRVLEAREAAEDVDFLVSKLLAEQQLSVRPRGKPLPNSTPLL
ncbi:MAG: ATP-binding protein [Thermoprotei archaeon]|nr:MAG: ATP-binding protein [Thermoprotei archaeon]